MPITLDSNQVSSITIDGTDVTEVTVDGDVVWTATVDPGFKMYLTGPSDNIWQYDLSTAYDISTASQTKSFDISNQHNLPEAIAVNDDGTKMYVVGSSNDDLYEYDLSTAYDVSTSSPSTSMDVSSYGAIMGISWNSDGTKLYLLDSSNEIHEFNVSTAFDISTASLSQTTDVSSQTASSLTGVAWNDDGTQMYICAYTVDPFGTDESAVHEYSCSTAFDISTASHTQDLSVVSEETTIQSVAWNDDGSKIYIVGSENNTVYEYNCSTAFDVSTASLSQNLVLSNANPDGLTWDVPPQYA